MNYAKNEQHVSLLITLFRKRVSQCHESMSKKPHVPSSDNASERFGSTEVMSLNSTQPAVPADDNKDDNKDDDDRTINVDIGGNHAHELESASDDLAGVPDRNDVDAPPQEL